MKKKILILTLSATLAAPTAFAAYLGDANNGANNGTNDDAVDVQTVNVIVPEVALLNVATGPISLTGGNLAPPTSAGSPFTGSATASTSYDISSNVLNTGDPLNTTAPTSRKITVMTDPTVGKVPDGAQLTVDVKVPATGATTGIATLTSNTASAQDSAIAIGNTRGTGLTITYALSTDPAGTGMIAHTASDGTASDNIGLIYTLTDD